MQNNRIKYAGFWIRLCAAIIDLIVMYIIIVILNLPVFNFIFFTFETIFKILFIFIGLEFAFNIILVMVQIITVIVISWLYFSLMESSNKQATLGKQALGIKVININGKPISFERATGRYFAKFISNSSLLVGYIMAAFTQKKQSLHDLIAKILVIKT